MTFWVIAAVMAAATVVALLWPLNRRDGKAAAAADYDRRVYRDQLAELEQDLRRGLIDETEAAAARREIERRLLQTEEDTASRPSEGGPGQGRSRGRRLALALVVCLPPLLGVGLYIQLGSPGLPGLPLAERDPGGPEELRLMVAQLEKRIAEVPEDIEARLVLAQVLERSGRFAEAAETYRGAITEIEKQGPVPGVLHAALGETLVAAAGGRVGRDARLAFAAAIEADPGNTRARYYAGLAMAQDGQLEQALGVWQDLAADLPATSPWRGLLRDQIGRAAGELGIEPPAMAGARPTPQDAPRGPGAADVEAAQDMTPEERTTFIRSMVTQLAERLEAAPEDPDGWLRLARAYEVLGEEDRAREALAAAEVEIAKLPEDSSERGTLMRRLETLRQNLP